MATDTTLRARMATAPKPGAWDEAATLVAEMVVAARGNAGTRYYDMYIDEQRGWLINLAEYDNEAAWHAWMALNRDRGRRLMELADVAEMEVYGDLSPELSAQIAQYGSARVHAPLPA